MGCAGAADGLRVGGARPDARALAIVAAPLPAVVAVVAAVCGRGLVLRVRWLLADTGPLAVPVVLVFGAWASHKPAAPAIVRETVDADAHGLLQAGPDGLLYAVVERVPGWTLGQAPLAAAAGVLAGGLWLAWRRQFRARWRKETAVQLPERRLEAAVAALRRTDDREPAPDLSKLR